MAFGATLFERRLASAQQAERDARARAAADRDQQERQFQKNLELAKFYRDREDADFDRKLKLAELRGKFLGNLGRPQESEGDFRLQETQDVGYLGGQSEALGATQKFDLQAQKDAEAEARLLASLGLRADIAGASASERQAANVANEDLRTRQLTEQERHNRAMEAKQSLMPMILLGERRERDLDKKIERLGKDVGEVGALQNSLATIDRVLQQKDIPGVGWLDAPVAALGLGSEEDISVRQAAQNLFNFRAHLISGGAVTDNEKSRNEIATGLGKFATQRQFKAGMKALKADIANGLRNIKAKYGPDAAAEYATRGGFDISSLESFLGGPEATAQDDLVNQIMREMAEE